MTGTACESAQRYGGLLHVLFFDRETHNKVTRHKMRNVLLLLMTIVGSATGELVKQFYIIRTSHSYFKKMHIESAQLSQAIQLATVFAEFQVGTCKSAKRYPTSN